MKQFKQIWYLREAVAPAGVKQGYVSIQQLIACFLFEDWHNCCLKINNQFISLTLYYDHFHTESNLVIENDDIQCLKYDVSLQPNDYYACVEATREIVKNASNLSQEEKDSVCTVGYGHVGDGNLHLNCSIPGYEDIDF